MNDLAGISGYLAAGLAVVLLGVAVALRSRRQPGEAPSGTVARSAPPAGVVRGRWRALAWCGTLAVVAVGLAARLWDTPGDLWAFWLLLAAGAAFAVAAHAGLGWPLPDQPPEPQPPGAAAGAPPPCASRRGLAALGRRAGVRLLAAALVAEAGALVLFGVGRLLSGAWLLHLLAAGLFLVGLWRAVEPAERRLFARWLPLDTLIVAIVMLAALAVRVWEIGAVPEGLWFDESQRGLEALRMLAERGYRPIFAAGVLQEPTGLWYLMLPFLATLGREAATLRLPVALGGAVGVGAIYLLAGLLYGRRVAVVAAGLAVALTWHLNFSRIALPAVLSVTCDTLAAALLVAGLRRESRFLLGAAGLVCAAGLSFYFTSQLMPFVLAAVVAHQLAVRGRPLLRRLWPGLLLGAAGFLLVAGPFLFYAVTRPEQFAARANAVTVMRDVENARSWTPVLANVRAHLLMFNVQGDKNGRHNWSGRPMLDPLTGGLAVAGLMLALSRAWKAEQLLLLVWLPVALFGGIFSSIWDAPQSHRAIDALVPAVILAALPLGLLWRAADRALASPGAATPRTVLGLPPRLVTAGAAIGLVLVTGVLNLDRYFQHQQRDAKTWADFMAPQTAAGRQVAALPADTRIYLEPNWADHPSVRFLDPRQRAYVPFEPGPALPVTDASAAIFIGARPGVAERIAALYPGAARTFTRAPDGSVAGYGFVLPPEVARSTRGVAARYQGGGGQLERRETGLALSWPGEAPLPPPFDAVWMATLSAPAYGSYRLRLDGPPTLSLTLDGVEVVRGGAETALRLARGSHALRLEGRELGREPVRLLWAPPNDELRPIPEERLHVAPAETAGLLARIYRGAGAGGDPVLEQVDPNVELRVHLLPAPRPYTVEWSGALRAERAGRYRFSLSSLGASALWLNGVEVVRKDVAEGVPEGALDLAAGWHDVRIQFVDAVDFSYVTAFWQPPDGEREPIPPWVLRPWPAERIAAARPEDAGLPVARP